MDMVVVALGMVILGLVFWGIVCVISGVVLAVMYRKQGERWQKIAAIVCGAIALICAAVLLVLIARGRGTA